MRLLVVEDDSAIRECVTHGLTEAGYQVDCTGEAKPALALAADAVYDGFIIDLGLPDMDGLDLIGKCRAQGQIAPVLILSTRRSVDERVPRIGAGWRRLAHQAFRIGRTACPSAQSSPAKRLRTIGGGAAACRRPGTEPAESRSKAQRGINSANDLGVCAA